PGDLLVVDILDLGPVPQAVGDAPGEGWGYTGIFAKANGGGFLTDHFPDAYKAIWDFSGQKCTSRHIPGVEFTGITHPGLFGTAPSPELLGRWNVRERAPPRSGVGAAAGAAAARRKRPRRESYR